MSSFPEDLFITPQAVASFKFSNLLSYNIMDRGGHFAAFEEPRLLATEIRSFVRMVEKL